MITKVTDGIYRKNERFESLEVLIDDIRSDKNKSIIKKYKSIKRQEQAKKFKKKLAMFEVCLDYGCSEGLRSNRLIYFDIDKKDNSNVDIEELKKSIIALPQTKFAFISPSGGLKFAIQTDFIEDVSEVTKAKYKIAYDLVHNWLLSQFSFIHDGAVRMLTATGFTSYDKNAYFSKIPKPFLVAAEIEDYEEPKPQAYNTGSVIPESYAEELFLAVPKDVGYQDMLICNYMIMAYSPHNAESLILQHWNKDAKKLKQKISSQKKNAAFGSIKAVQNIILNSGGKLPPTPNHLGGKHRKLMIAEKCNHEFNDLLEPDAAQEVMDQHIEKFFNEKTSMCLRVSAGFGKTKTVLRSIARHAKFHKILYFAPTHKFLDEADKRYIELSKQDETYGWDIKPNHIYSRSGASPEILELCINDEVRERYHQEQKPIRYAECLNCPFNGECNYVEQFNNLSRVTFRPTTNLFNRKGVWENGSIEVLEEGKKTESLNYDGDVKSKPRKDARKPDYIVVDENCVFLDRFHVDGNATSQCLKHILADLHVEKESADIQNKPLIKRLSQIVEKYREQVIDDYDDLCDQFIAMNWKTGDSYFQELGKFPQHEFHILESLYRFVVAGCDESELYGFTFGIDQNGVGKLSVSVLRHVAEHFQDIPVLILDATANEMVMRQLFPKIEFHKIDVKPNGNVKIYQCQNATFSRNFLNDDQVLDQLIEQMNCIIRKGAPSKIGLITYLNVGKTKKFDKLLAGKLEHNNVVFRHFGDIRGTNELGDVDLFFQVGKQQMSYQDTIAQAEAIFQTDLDPEMITVPVPVRMSDGKSMALSNRCFCDERVMAVYDQLSRSETVQAVARSRPIFGSEKSVYLFTNEALGGDIAVSEFFDFDRPGMPPYWKNLIKIGFVRTKTACMCELGYTERQLQSGSKEKVVMNFVSRGCELLSVSFKSKYYKAKVHEYLVHDRSAFEKRCLASDWTILE